MRSCPVFYQQLQLQSQSHYSIKSDNTECSSFEDSASHEATDDRRPLSLSSLRTLLPPSVALRGKKRWIFSFQTIIKYFLFNQISHDFCPIVCRILQTSSFASSGQPLVRADKQLMRDNLHRECTRTRWWCSTTR